jgi:hypothetical protein
VYYNGSVYGRSGAEVGRATAVCHYHAVFQSTATPLSLENGFPLEQSDLIANTFAVNKNYHPGYAQNWTTSIQETFARVYVLSVAYNGIKGTDLDVLQLPNRSPLGTPQLLVQSNLMIPNAGEFTYDNSVGNSSYNALQIQLQRRISRGASFGILYTFSKAIDDSSTLGGGPVLIPNDISRGAGPFAHRSAARSARQLPGAVAHRQHADGIRGDCAAGLDHRRRFERDFRHAVHGHYKRRLLGHGLYRGCPRASHRAACHFRFGFLQSAGVRGAGYWDFRRCRPRHHSRHSAILVDGVVLPLLPDRRQAAHRVPHRQYESDQSCGNITAINTTVGSIQYGLPTNAGAMRSITATVRLDSDETTVLERPRFETTIPGAVPALATGVSVDAQDATFNRTPTS